MHAYTDRIGRTWKLELDVGSVRQIKTECGIDLIDGLDSADGKPGALDQLANNPLTLFEVLHVLCRDQIDRLEIPAKVGAELRSTEADPVQLEFAQQEWRDKEFARGLAGDGIDRATEAFLKELTDFFPYRRREAMKALLAKMTELDRRTSDWVIAKVNEGAMDRQIQAALDEADRRLAELLGPDGNSSGTPPESSAFTPIAGPSASSSTPPKADPVTCGVSPPQ